MTKSTVPKNNTSKGSRSKKAGTRTSFTAAHDKVIEGIKKHGKAQNTTKNYDGHVRQGIAFLEQFSVEESEAEGCWKGGENPESNLTADGEEQMHEGGEQSKMHPKFREAFNGIPIECTPLAIAMFIAHKCLTEDCGKSTASGIHAGFLAHYDKMQGDKYRGRWRYDHITKEWTGNPVRTAEVEDMVEACKNKDGEGERRHSRAISLDDMKQLHKYFELHCPTLDQARSFAEQKKEISERGSYLLFNALSSSAFTAWMRIGEVTSLKYKNLEFPKGRRKEALDPTMHFFKLNLRNRKNWQSREKRGEHQLNGHMYTIYPQSSNPEIDMYTHLLTWLDFYERFLLGRPLTDEDYIFPTIGSNGTSVQPSCAISSDIAQKKIAHMAQQAGIPGAKYFTTHCFRRGGAQYRFMFAPMRERWTLARVRWWGGWAPGEQRDTLIRYLLDELYTYEEDHSNALCPNPKPTMSESSAELEFLEGLRNDLCMQVTVMKTKIQECRTLLNRAIHSPNTTPVPMTVIPTTSIRRSSTSSPLSVTTQPSPSNAITQHEPSPEHQLPQSQEPPFQFEIDDRVNLIPKLPQNRSARAYEQVVRDWEFADPARSLYVPMKDWRPEWHKERNLTQKYGQRQMVAVEFINHFNRDKAQFEETYPEHKRGFTPLLEAIRRAQQERGDCEVRLTRRKCRV